MQNCGKYLQKQKYSCTAGTCTNYYTNFERNLETYQLKMYKSENFEILLLSICLTEVCAYCTWKYAQECSLKHSVVSIRYLEKRNK